MHIRPFVKIAGYSVAFASLALSFFTFAAVSSGHSPEFVEPNKIIILAEMIISGFGILWVIYKLKSLCSTSMDRKTDWRYNYENYRRPIANKPLESV